VLFLDAGTEKEIHSGTEDAICERQRSRLDGRYIQQ